ncbi:MAG: TIGR04222 domain-containing membrane protein [Betaproteobacteria bacterium]
MLTQVAGHAVSPAPDVDAAWHLHLTRTAHYERFCQSVFGRFLHHEPSRGGSVEDQRHRGLYESTLKAYRAAFGADAPAPIWPEPGTPREPARAPAPAWQVPAVLRRHRRLAFASLSFVVVFAIFLRATDFLRPLQLIPPAPFLLAAMALAIALGWLGLRGGATSPGAPERDALEPYEAAWFGCGARRMTMTAIAALVERGTLRHGGPSADPRAPRPPLAVDRTVAPQPRHPAEAACLRAATDAGLRGVDASAAMQPLAEQFERRLSAAGLANEGSSMPLRRAQALVGVVALLVIQLERILHAAGGGHPVGLLVALTMADVVLLFVLCRRPQRANARARDELKRLRAAAVARGKAKAPPAGVALAFGVALMGTAALAGDLRFGGLDRDLNGLMLGDRRPGGGGGGDSGGSSCSSCSSCGGDGGSSDGGGSSSDGGGSSCGSSCGGGGGD